MIRFRPHASSSAGNLYEVFSEPRGSRLAIELGLPWRRVQRMLDHRTRDFEAALISHAHGDHAQGAERALESAVDVWASEGTWMELGLENHHRARVARPGQAIELDSFRVVPFSLRHGDQDALGFVVAERNGTGRDQLVYACDTAYVPYRFEHTTHFAIECNWSRKAVWESSAPFAQKVRVIKEHMSLERVVQCLLANDLSRVREVWLLHVSDRHGDWSEFRKTVERAVGKPTYVAPRDRIGG